MSGAADESRITDPTLEADLRLTMREWVVYWKVKYETQLVKVKEAVDIFDRLKLIIKEQQEKILLLEKQKEAMDAQWRAEQTAREAEAKAEPTGGDCAPRPKRLRKAEAQG